MKIIRWSIENPAAIIAIYLGLLVMSAASVLYLIPTRMMPYVESPMVGIITKSMGLSAEDVETYISKPIEEAMTDLNGVRFIRSTSMNGMSVVSLEFYYHYDMKKAVQDVQNLMTNVQSKLRLDPANYEPPWVLPIDPLNTPVLRLALTAPGRDPIALRQLADNAVVNRLKTVPGVESVYAFGGYKRQAQVIVDRDKLAAVGLSMLDVKKAVDGANVDRSAGTLTWGPSESIVRIADRARSGGELANVVLAAPNNRPIYLHDVARVEDTFAERRSLYRYNGREAVEVNVIQRPDASSPVTIAAVMQEVRRLGRDYPGLHFAVAYDNAHFVEIVKKNMFEELASAVVLTGLVLFLFLGEWRGTLVAMVTIPTSLAFALIFFVPLGLSLNSSTLIGLLLAIGRLVDDSIIDLHSVQRHLRMGKDSFAAALDGCTEVRKAVIAATVMICLAMLPLTFSGGLTQDMFEGIVWPFLLALVASLFVALTLTPLLAACIFRGWKPDARERRPALRRLENGYRGLLGWALRHRGMVIATAGVAVYLALLMYPLIGSEMMPLADVGQAYGTMEAVPGTSLAETSRMAAAIEKILLSHPEVEKVSTQVGYEPGGTYFTGYGVGGVNTASFMITLSDMDDRKKSIWNVIDDTYARAMRTIPNLRRLSIKEMGSDVMASSAAPIQVLIYGPDLKRLDWLAERAKELAQHIPGLYQVATSWSLDQPEWRVQVDQRRAAAVGLTPEQVANQAYYALNGGLTFNDFHPPVVRQDTVLIRYEQSQRRNPSDLEDVVIVGKDGQRMPLKALATVTLHHTTNEIEHDNLRRVNSILAFYRRGGPGSMQLTMDLMMKSLLTLPFPPGYGMEQRGDMTQMMDSFNRLLIGLALALVFIYLSLVMEFRSLVQPLTLMAAIPLELVGVFGGLVLAHQTFSTVSILGIVVLNGMDVTASILLVDMIAHLRERDVPRDRAILEAGPVRLMPIVMTVLVTLVVMIPVAFFPKTGMDAYAPLGTVIVGGLAMSTLLTLVAVPVLYTVVDDARAWVRQRWQRRRTAVAAEDAP